MIRGPLGSRASIGGVLGSGRGGVTLPAWAIAGGVSAANVVACYQPKGAASLAASYVNLANPGTYDAAAGTAPTWAAATGWLFDLDFSQYLTTGITPANSGWSFVCRYVATRSGAICGSGTPTNKMFHWQRYINSMYYANGTYTETVGDFSGTMAIAGLNGYLDGSFDKAIGSAWTGGSSVFMLGASSTPSNTPTFYSTSTIAAIAIYNTTLTAPQVAAISAAMAAL